MTTLKTMILIFLTLLSMKVVVIWALITINLNQSPLFSHSMKKMYWHFHLKQSTICIKTKIIKVIYLHFAIKMITKMRMPAVRWSVLQPAALIFNLYSMKNSFLTSTIWMATLVKVFLFKHKIFLIEK